MSSSLPPDLVRMNTEERRAHSLELKRLHADEFPTTSLYHAHGAYSHEDVERHGDAHPIAIADGTPGVDRIIPGDGQAIQQGTEAYIQQARISSQNNNPMPKTEPLDVTLYRACRDGAHERRKDGQYNFDRFRDVHLFSLCLYQEEIEALYQAEIQALTTQTQLYVNDEGSEQPSEPPRENIENLRSVLKAYSEEMLTLDQLMRLTTAVNTDHADLNHRKAVDPIRSFFTKVVVSIQKRKLRTISHNTAILKASPVADMLARCVIAILGGALLIVPIVLMTYFKTRNANLIITSVFTVAFALGTSLVSTASNQEVLAATAAYAAVLVVFVGTSSAP